jgi:hypothetical protein
LARRSSSAELSPSPVSSKWRIISASRPPCSFNRSLRVGGSPQVCRVGPAPFIASPDSPRSPSSVDRARKLCVLHRFCQLRRRQLFHSLRAVLKMQPRATNCAMPSTFKAALAAALRDFGLNAATREHLKRWADDDRAEEVWDRIKYAAQKQGSHLPHGSLLWRYCRRGASPN